MARLHCRMQILSVSRENIAIRPAFQAGLARISSHQLICKITPSDFHPSFSIRSDFSSGGRGNGTVKGNKSVNTVCRSNWHFVFADAEVR